MSDFLDQLNQAIPDEPKESPSGARESLEDPTEGDSSYFQTFKNIRGQLFAECQRMKQEAYSEALNLAMSEPATIKALEQGGLFEQRAEENAKAKAEKARAKAAPSQPLGVAILLKKYIRFVKIKPEAQGQEAPLYFYNPDSGVWLEDNEFLQDLIAVIFPIATKKQALDVLYKIARQVPTRPIQKHYTVIGNQLYNSKTRQFEPLTPSIIATRKIKTGYSPEAKEPNINGWKPTKWLLELFDGDKELYRLAIQIIKATITGQSLQKIFWLYGEGGTGKGTFQQLLENLVGLENVASLKITALGKSQFTTSILLGKSLVIGDDVQKDAVIKDTSDMFSLATGDIMTIEDKGRRPYSLRLNMTVVQSSNGLPRMNGDKSAIDRRFRILPFTSTFKGEPNKAIKSDYINRKEVLEYLVKLAIETPLEDLNPLKSVELLEEHHKDMNPVIDFVSRFFTEDITSDFLPNSFVYHVWKNYLEYYNKPYRLAENALHREIKSNLPPTFRAGRRTIPAGRQIAKGFYPENDLPPYASKAYYNGREKKERLKKPKDERGYLHFKKKQ